MAQIEEKSLQNLDLAFSLTEKLPSFLVVIWRDFGNPLLGSGVGCDGDETGPTLEDDAVMVQPGWWRGFVIWCGSNPFKLSRCIFLPPSQSLVVL